MKQRRDERRGRPRSGPSGLLAALLLLGGCPAETPPPVDAANPADMTVNMVADLSADMTADLAPPPDLVPGCSPTTPAPMPETPASVALTCDTSQVSCKTSGGNACCTPTRGLHALALQWLPGLCKDPKSPCNSCVQANAKAAGVTFTMHGLWPNECSGTYATSCDPIRAYSQTVFDGKIGTGALLADLNTYWPSAYTDPNPVFWSYEWERHGTCAGVFDPSCYGTQPVTDVHDFFALALGLLKSYDPHPRLAARGITPSATATYTLTQLQDAFLAEYGHRAQILCVNAGNGEYHVSEIRLFFNVSARTSYTLADPPSNAMTTTCGATVRYPPYL